MEMVFGRGGIKDQIFSLTFLCLADLGLMATPRSRLHFVRTYERLVLLVPELSAVKSMGMWRQGDKKSILTL